ncbi:hypothetical protein LJC74_01190 [Eubacteriales bacterium OttesenSCG-928-A19]|nr:hypothetical protein [Eubacteriales bacterium OttesenSCG-928-A19]
MKKAKVEITKKPNWKFWILLTIVFVLFAILIITLIFLDTISWINLIILPLVINLVAGAGISLYFTIKTDKERLVDELQREIEEVLERTIYLSRVFVEVAQNPFQSIVLKKQILTQETMKTPSMFRVREIYRELWVLYKENRDKIISEMDKWDSQGKASDFLGVFQTHYGPTILLHIMEISDCALRVQEQYFQDFKGERRKPIPPQLIYEIKPTQEQKPN